MAVCVLSKNLEKSTACGYDLPQIVDIYLANYADVKTTTVGAPDLAESGVEVKTIVMQSEAKWYHIEPNKNSASWSDNLAVGGNNNKYKIHTVSFAYSSSYNPDMVDTVDSLALGRYIAVLKMANGSFIMLGRNVGMEALENDSVQNNGSGDATAEGGMSVTLTANTTESALPLSEEAIAVVVPPAA